MKVDISSLRRVVGKKIEDTIVCKKDWINAGGDMIRLLSPIVVNFTAINQGNTIDISGKIATSLELGCGRCLKKISYPLETHFNEIFYHESQFEQQNDRVIVEEGKVFTGNVLDLLEVVEQNIIIELPLKVVCGEQCKGFCVKCGIDLNRANCQCIIGEEDPRLAVLAKLLKPGCLSKEVEK